MAGQGDKPAEQKNSRDREGSRAAHGGHSALQGTVQYNLPSKALKMSVLQTSLETNADTQHCFNCP